VIAGRGNQSLAMWDGVLSEEWTITSDLQYMLTVSRCPFKDASFVFGGRRGGMWKLTKKGLGPRFEVMLGRYKETAHLSRE
jgi:hypothetical protein